MKKFIFCSFLVTALFLPGRVGFSAKTPDEEGTAKAEVAAESFQNFILEEAQPSDEDAFREDDFFVKGSPRAPVATVSGAEEKRGVEAPVSRVSSKMSSEERGGASASKSKISSALDSQEMERRWKALFSKEITPDSMAYTVKSGDSLYVLALKNHTTVDFIKKINGLKGDSIYPKMKLKIHTAPFSMVVDKSKNTLVLYSGDVPVKKYLVATGKENSTPVGKFKITDKLMNPTWFKTGAILPPGSPKNALGTRWMGFDKRSYGIHGTIEPQSIGTQASEGCIRMLNEEVEELYSLVPVGTKVTIQD